MRRSFSESFSAASAQTLDDVKARGQLRAGAPLSALHRARLDLLEELLGLHEHAVRFRLEEGDVLWVNNRTLAHDQAGSLQRMWIQARW